MKGRWMVAFFTVLMGNSVFALMDDAQMSVWVNEAIVSTYTYTYSNQLSRQKQMAAYFTAGGWIAYSKALSASNLPESVNKNKYTVSAVATMPPEISKMADHQWKAVMPLLVLYKNPNHQQTQTLNVALSFTEAPSGEGVRGLAITRMEVKSSTPPCSCPTP